MSRLDARSGYSQGSQLQTTGLKRGFRCVYVPSVVFWWRCGRSLGALCGARVHGFWVRHVLAVIFDGYQGRLVMRFVFDGFGSSPPSGVGASMT